MMTISFKKIMIFITAVLALNVHQVHAEFLVDERTGMTTELLNNSEGMHLHSGVNTFRASCAEQNPLLCPQLHQGKDFNILSSYPSTWSTVDLLTDRPTLRTAVVDCSLEIKKTGNSSEQWITVDVQKNGSEKVIIRNRLVHLHALQMKGPFPSTEVYRLWDIRNPNKRVEIELSFHGEGLADLNYIEVALGPEQNLYPFTPSPNPTHGRAQTIKKFTCGEPTYRLND